MLTQLLKGPSIGGLKGEKKQENRGLGVRGGLAKELEPTPKVSKIERKVRTAVGRIHSLA